MNQQDFFNQKFRPGLAKTQTPNLRAQIRGGMGLDRPAQENRADLQAAARITRAMNNLVQKAEAAITAMDRAQARQVAQPAPPPAQVYQSMAPNFGVRLPLPKTGEIGQGYPSHAHVVTRAATTPAGAAAAAVNLLREGAEPQLRYQPKKSGLTPAQAARQNMPKLAIY